METSKKNGSGSGLGAKFGQNLPAQCCEKVKKRVLSIGFFRILQGEYILKQNVVVAHTPEWKFKVNISRNVTFEGRLGPNFCPIWVKNGKKIDYFQEFHFS